jgi:tRNA dimethylallyltransferase
MTDRAAGRPPAVLLMGPTASGKTGVAVELAARFPLEIVSVDSAQVYRHMDVGTAKPGPDLLRRAPHHLIDILEPTERYCAARFVEDANALMAEITARGRVPLLAGGTMLYFKALREGLSNLPAADPDVRLVIDAMAADSGWPALHEELARIDPDTAERLEPADAQRIQRALEVFYLTGEPLSAHLARGRSAGPPYRLVAVALEPGERGALHERIAVRFETMLELGLIGEVRRLRETYDLNRSLPAMRAVGYRQVWQYLEGEIGLAGLREKGVAATRQLAKRQLTWLRAMPDATRFDCLAEDLAEQVCAAVGAQLG